MVRLAGSVAGVFEEKIRPVLPPERVERVLNRIREARGGEMNDNRFGHRMRGTGTYWKSTAELFQLALRKYGYADIPPLPSRDRFRVPSPQLELDLQGEQ